jgi:hypothetical protein
MSNVKAQMSKECQNPKAKISDPRSGLQQAYLPENALSNLEFCLNIWHEDLI